jgi:TRAP-type C4-dicarboxylate transport system permease small subunit
MFFKNISRYFAIAVDQFETWSLIICVAALSVLLITNVIAREFFKSIYFVEEIIEFLVIFITFVGVSYGVRRARHIRMAAFLDLMPASVEKIFVIAISAISAVVMFFMAYSSYEYLINSLVRAHKTPALRLPYWLFYVIVPIGFGMAGIQYLRTILKNFTVKETWLSSEQQSEYEEEIK